MLSFDNVRTFFGVLKRKLSAFFLRMALFETKSIEYPMARKKRCHIYIVNTALFFILEYQSFFEIGR